MVNVELSEKEIGLLKMSINHCLETCENNEKESKCTDCEVLKSLLAKL